MAAGKLARAREPLSADAIRRIHRGLRVFVSSREQEERLQTAITPEEAQSILNNVQTWLDARSEKPYHIPLLWRSAIYVLYSLVNEHKIWPTSMVIKGCVFDDTSELGTGGSATVYVGKWQGKDVAVKKVHMSKDVKKSFVREVVTWKQLHNRYIVPFYGICPDPQNSAGFIMVSELMPKTLRDYVSPGPDPLASVTPGGYCSRLDRMRLVKELAEAIAYLHARKIVHGDIKDVNIMIDRDNHIRVTDFGLSLVGDDTQGAPTTTRSGAHSEGWTAPELYHDNMKRRMMPRDVYAFACVCYMLITGKPPYDKETRYTYFAQMVAQKKRRGSPAAVDCLGGIPASPQLWEIIQQCWRDRPHMRFTMKHILACLDMDIRFICYTGAVPFFSTRATRAYAAEVDTDLAFEQGDTIEVLDCSSDRWEVRNLDGKFGHVVLDPDHIKSCTLVRVQASAAYTARTGRDIAVKELSFLKGESLDVVAFGQQWWLARNDKNQSGIVPANQFKVPSPKDWVRDPNKYESVALVDYTPSVHEHCHLPFKKDQTVKLCRRPEGADYFIGEVEIDGNPVIGIVPAYMVAPVDDQGQPDTP